VTIAQGTPHNAVRYIPLMLTGTARTWIEILPEKYIHNWLDLKTAFEKNFEGTYKRPHTYDDLQRCSQQQGESSRAFLARWIEIKNSCTDVNDQKTIGAFIGSVECEISDIRDLTYPLLLVR